MRTGANPVEGEIRPNFGLFAAPPNGGFIYRRR